MQYVDLGKSGLKVSRTCLGTMTYGTPHWRPWVLDEAQARPIIGASKLTQLEQAVAALEIKLSAEDISFLEEPYQPHPVLGHS